MQAVCHLDNMLGNQVAGGIARQHVDKRFINLQNVDVERMKIVQVGVAGAEIIDGDFISRIAERLDHRRRFRHVDKPAFGHFDFDLFRLDRVALDLLVDVLNQACGMEIGSGEVNRHVQMRLPRQKLAQVGKYLIDDIVGDLGDHPFIFRHRNELRRTHHRPIKAWPAQ